MTNAHIVRRINTRRAWRYYYDVALPWAFAVAFVSTYGFMGWMAA